MAGSAVLYAAPSAKPRGFGAVVSNHTDLELIVTCPGVGNEVDWVFFGICRTYLRQYIREFIPGNRVSNYEPESRPRHCAAGRTPFNMAKVVCVCWSTAYWDIRLSVPISCCIRAHFRLPGAQSDGEWVATIREHIGDLVRPL